MDNKYQKKLDEYCPFDFNAVLVNWGKYSHYLVVKIYSYDTFSSILDSTFHHL